MSVGLLSAIIFILSAAGGLAPVQFKARLDEGRMRLLTAIAGGFLLGSALLVVVPEGFHAAQETANGPSGLILGLSLLAGFLLMLLFEGFGVGHSVHEEHHDHAAAHGHGHVHHPESGGTLPLGLSIHAVADGIAIGAAGVSGQAIAASLVALAVLLHKVPAAFSLGIYSSHERASKAEATRDVVAFSLVTPIALMASSVVLKAGSSLIALVLLFSAGTFLYVATVDTLPSVHSSTETQAFKTVAGAVLFAAIFLALDATGLVNELH